MRHWFLFVVSFYIFSPEIMAQKDSLSAKKHIKMAENLASQGKAEAAALHLEAAWLQKPTKKEYLLDAAKLFVEARDYQKARNCYEKLKDDPTMPQARLAYAKILQQCGAYDEAIPEYLLYLNNYEAPDREKVTENIEEYIKGCTYGIRQSDSVESVKVQMTHLNESVNSSENEVAPLPFGDDVLYFTTVATGKARLNRSQLVNSEWTMAQEIKNLPIPADKPFGNGSFSPDGTRFYYTQCHFIENKKEKRLSCAIYMLKRTASGWSEPQPLRSYINTEGGMTTQPNVVHRNGKEYLFFTSDRKGGRGGMDIWSTQRDLSTDSDDFDMPQNLGALVNTEGDELTPFYDAESSTMYFASNGRPTLGGFDMFKANGFEQRWTAPENMGAPINSSADDWYFSLNSSRSGGFLASNRAFGIEKISTLDDDIFHFSFKNKQDLLVEGRVFDKKSTSLLENARVSLYENLGRDRLRLLSSMMCAEGHFSFSLLLDKKFVLEVEKDGYRLLNEPISTRDSAKNVEKDFYLEKYQATESPRIVNVETPNKTENKAENPKNTPKTDKPKPAVTSANVRYKIQILAYEQLDNAYRMRLARVQDLGNFDTEYLADKQMTRVLIASFDSYEAASTTLRKVKDRAFPDAFIVRYENGKRTSKTK